MNRSAVLRSSLETITSDVTTQRMKYKSKAGSSGSRISQTEENTEDHQKRSRRPSDGTGSEV